MVLQVVSRTPAARSFTRAFSCIAQAYFRAEYDAAASELVVHAEEGLLPAQGW